MSDRFQSILLGGLVAGLLSTSYLGVINLLCCAGVIIGAMVAVWHYTTEHEVTLPAGQGAAMGALAAIVGGLIGLALEYLVGLVGVPSFQEIQQDFFSQFYPAEQAEQIEAMQEQQGSPMMMALMVVFGFGITAVFGAAGGAIGASIFKKGPAAGEGMVRPE